METLSIENMIKHSKSICFNSLEDISKQEIIESRIPRMTSSANYKKTKNGKRLGYGGDNAYHKRNRISLMNYLGGVECLACGFDIYECLEFDHINSDGNIKRKLFGTGAKMLGHYLNNLDEAERDLQVLCANCNSLKKVVLKEYKHKTYEE